MNEMMGKSTLECARFVVGQNPNIETIIVRPYLYVPNEISKGEEQIRIEREHFLNNFNPKEILVGRTEGTNVALDSNLILREGKEAYWPMVDMAPDKNQENLEKIKTRVKEMLSSYTGRSFLLETRRSYHLLGVNILDNKEEWLNFLGACLISSIVTKTPDNQPNIHEVIVDYRYIGYSILRRSTGLRLTTEGKKIEYPKVVAVVG